MLRSQFNRLYYAFKPYLPWRLRFGVRRWFALRKRHRMAAAWPILEEAGRAPEGWPGWPDGKRFAFVLTHDIEGPRGLEGCRRLAELEMGLGFRSAFNFVPEGGYETPASLRQWLGENGFEVGVHDLNHDGWLYEGREGFRQKAAKINRYLSDWQAVGFRSGFMHHNYDWLHDLDVLYDSSSFDTDPFEPQPDGVRTIFPFWMESPTPGARPGYVEMPYTLPQDSTLFLLFVEPDIDIWVRKLRWIADRGGMALINVHPDYLQFSGTKPSAKGFPASHYEKLLQHVKSEYGGQYWPALPREVAHWVKQHHRVCRNPLFQSLGGASKPEATDARRPSPSDKVPRGAVTVTRRIAG